MLEMVIFIVILFLIITLIDSFVYCEVVEIKLQALHNYWPFSGFYELHKLAKEINSFRLKNKGFDHD